ncbi:uncharacterized protein [Porites lutea]|uniref:uncharacterized protein n=1 Tax=Porites lutea TaxID=51062 RepID=UPI003CC60D4F
MFSVELSVVLVVVCGLLPFDTGTQASSNYSAAARDKTTERIELEVKNTSLLNTAEDGHRRQAGVSDENEEGGCEYETVQPVRMECGYATLRRQSTKPGEGSYTSLTTCDRGACSDSPMYVNQVPSPQYTSNG